MVEWKGNLFLEAYRKIFDNGVGEYDFFYTQIGLNGERRDENSLDIKT